MRSSKRTRLPLLHRAPDDWQLVSAVRDRNWLFYREVTYTALQCFSIGSMYACYVMLCMNSWTHVDFYTKIFWQTCLIYSQKINIPVFSKCFVASDKINHIYEVFLWKVSDDMDRIYTRFMATQVDHVSSCSSEAYSMYRIEDAIFLNTNCTWSHFYWQWHV